MSIYFPDIIKHNNPNLALTDSNYIRGGRRVVADFDALYELYNTHSDQMAENITIVYVVEEDAAYLFVDEANADNEDGWVLQNLPSGVSSVGLSLPDIFQVTNTPVTESDTIIATLSQQEANTVLAGPETGSDDVPTFRALVADDIPGIGWEKIIEGTPDSLGGYGILDAVNIDQLGVADGVATLDGSGKVPMAQLPAAVTGALVYQGTWNATTNTPTLASGTGTTGHFYKVSVAGTTTIDTISSWQVGDMILFDGTTWDKIDGATNEVVTVFGRYGAVTAQSGDYTFAQITAKPTTLAGYGILDAVNISELGVADGVATLDGTGKVPSAQLPADTVTSVFGRIGDVTAQASDYTFAQIGAKPTTLAGYGITNGVPYTGATTNVNLNSKTLFNVSSILVGAATSPNIIETIQVVGSLAASGIVVGSNTKTEDYTLTHSDYTIRVDATLADVDITLPPIDAITIGQMYIIKRIDNSANAVVVFGTNIDGTSQQVLSTQYQVLRLQYTGAGYDII